MEKDKGRGKKEGSYLSTSKLHQSTAREVEEKSNKEEKTATTRSALIAFVLGTRAKTERCGKSLETAGVECEREEKGTREDNIYTSIGRFWKSLQ